MSLPTSIFFILAVSRYSAPRDYSDTTIYQLQQICDAGNCGTRLATSLHHHFLGRGSAAAQRDYLTLFPVRLEYYCPAVEGSGANA